MYEHADKAAPSARRRDLSLVPHIALVALIATALITPLALMAHTLYRFQEFKLDLAESMAHAEQQGALSRDEADRFFKMIVDAGMGKPHDEAPQSEGVCFAFGDGSTLELWGVDIDGDPENPGTFVRYTRADGSVFAYDTDKIDYDLAADTLGIRIQRASTWHRMDEYTVCDQCGRRCSVELLRCAVGRKRYHDVTGKDYVPPQGIEEDDGAAYRRIIRERRARREKAPG